MYSIKTNSYNNVLLFVQIKIRELQKQHYIFHFKIPLGKILGSHEKSISQQQT